MSPVSAPDRFFLQVQRSGIGVLIILLLTAAVFIYILIKTTWVAVWRCCPRDQWATIIHTYTGMPRTFLIRVVSKDGNAVAGTFRETKGSFPLQKAIPREGTLQANMTFHRAWTDGIYQLDILPTQDVEVFID